MWPVAAGSRAQRLAVGATSPWPRAAGYSSHRAPDDVLPAAPWPGPGALRWAFPHLLVSGMGCCRFGNRAELGGSHRVLGSGVKPMEGCDELIDLVAFKGLIPLTMEAGAPLQRAEGVRRMLQPRGRSGAPARRDAHCGGQCVGRAERGLIYFADGSWGSIHAACRGCKCSYCSPSLGISRPDASSQHQGWKESFHPMQICWAPLARARHHELQRMP